MERGKNK